jgi:hypothetical protein
VSRSIGIQVKSSGPVDALSVILQLADTGAKVRRVDLCRADDTAYRTAAPHGPQTAIWEASPDDSSAVGLGAGECRRRVAGAWPSFLAGRPIQLQPQLPRAILPEQAAISDVPPHHLNGPVPGLVHDRPL